MPWILTDAPPTTGPAARLAWNLARARARAKRTQDEAAALTGLSRAAVARMESGRGLPRLRSLLLLARAYHTPVATLMEGIDLCP